MMPKMGCNSNFFVILFFVAARSGAGTVIKAEMGKGYRLLNRNP
jgi:hypothetical protein